MKMSWLPLGLASLFAAGCDSRDPLTPAPVAGEGAPAPEEASPSPPGAGDLPDGDPGASTGPDAGSQVQARPFHFVDRGIERGLTGVNHCGHPTEKRYLVEEIGSGAALFDFDADGDLDAYVVDGCSVVPPGAEVIAPASMLPPSTADDWRPGFDGASRLYRNDGRGFFDDVTTETQSGYAGMGSGAIAGDVDNDGDADLYLTAWGPNRLLMNDSGERFEDRTDSAGVGDPLWSVGACFLDYDLDGSLDLYSANYFSLTTGRDPEVWNKLDCPHEDLSVACGPKTMVADPDKIYRNRGDGTFEESSNKCGIDLVEARYALGVVAFDCDKDGDTDLYVANDSRGNYLFVNEDGSFEEWADLAAVSLNASGVPQAGMGIGVGDYDGDLDLDLHLTNFSHDDNTLYRNDRHRSFQDVSMRIRFGEAIYFALGWGTDFGDFDQDADVDLFVANGHIYPQADERAPELTYRQLNRLFAIEAGKLTDVTLQAGPGLQKLASTRGAAFGDVDGDGDLDALLVEMNEAPTLLINESPSLGGSVLVSVEGDQVNRDGIGAKVLVTVAGKKVMQEVRAGHSFASCSDRRLHFGTGAAATIEHLRVVWPGGRREEYSDLPVGGVIHIREGGGYRFTEWGP